MNSRFTHMGIALLLGAGLVLALAEDVMGSGSSPAATVRYVATLGACGDVTPCYATIQAAVDAAVTGDEVRVAAGSYTGVTTRSGIKQVVFLDKGLTVRGGFTAANWATPNPTLNQTTVDGQGLGRGVVISGTLAITPVVILEGVRITGGNATGLGGYGGATSPAGGGVYVYLAQATLHDCAIFNNTADAAASGPGHGGGVAALFSTLTLDGSTIENNRASTGGIGYGGGVVVKNYPGWGGQVTLSANTIRNNTASAASTGWGGGIHLDTVTANLTGNAIADNTATSAAGARGYGGGIRADSSELTLTNNTVQGNLASMGGPGGGGGVFLRDANAILTDNRLTGNIAATATVGDGGGLYAVSELSIRTATITLTGNTFQDNAACGNAAPAAALCRGGGIELWRVKASLTGNLVQGNTAGNTAMGSTPVNNNSRGGGISLNEPFDTALTANTVRENIANSTGYGYGGGIEVSAQVLRPGLVVLTSNTVQGNSGSQGFTGHGGGIFTSDVAMTLSSNVIAANTASKGKDGFGGGFYAESGVLTLSDNTIENNVASTADQGVGGGLSFCYLTLDVRAAATLTGNTVRGNTGSTATTNTSGWQSGAGGLDLWLADGTIRGNTFTSNTGATAQAAYCGGVAIYAGVHAAVSFTDNLVQDNTASAAAAGGGGGGLCASGNAVVSGNSILGNTAAMAGSGNGGGVMIGLGLRGASLGGPTTVAGNTVQGNVAGDAGDGKGGGLYVARNTMDSTDIFTVTHNLIADNVASRSGAGSGGGIYLGPSYAARLDANTILGNIASQNSGMTGVGGGLAIASSHAFSVTNSVIAHNRADTQGSGVWLGKTGNLSEPLTWGRFLHTTIADNQVGAGIWLESPLYAGTLVDPYTSGTQLKVTTPCFYRVGDTLLILHTDGTTRSWRRLVAIGYGDAWRLTLDSALPYAYPVGSTVRDTSAVFVDTILAGHTIGLGALDQPVTLVGTLWDDNAMAVTDNLGAIVGQGDVTGAPAFLNAAAGDYHIGSGSADARDSGVDAGIRADMDGDVRPAGPGYDIGADEYTSSPTRTLTPTATTHPAATSTATPTPTITPATATPTRTPSGPHVYLPLVLRR